MEYTIEKKVFPVYEYDEELERETDKLIGYDVFSTIKISEHLVVRTTINNTSQRQRPLIHKGWWVEWRATFPNSSSAHARLTPDDKTFWSALRWAEANRDAIEALSFSNSDQGLAAVGPFQRAGHGQSQPT